MFRIIVVGEVNLVKAKITDRKIGINNPVAPNTAIRKKNIEHHLRMNN
ncbi:hypothetical protein [Chryseobacterium gambrini]